jgi:hypothetical protein
MKKRRFTVFLSDAQHSAVMDLSAQAGQSMSDWISHTISLRIHDLSGANTPTPSAFTRSAKPAASLFSDDEWESAVPSLQDVTQLDKNAGQA